MNNQELFNEIVNDIFQRCDYKIEKMNIIDLAITKQIMIQIRDNVHDFIKNYWHIVAYFSELDLEKEIERHKQPDLVKIHELFNDNLINTIDRRRF